MKQQRLTGAKLAAVLVILLCGIALGVLLANGSQRLSAKARASPDQRPRASAAPHSVRELLASAPDQLNSLDIAVMNLLCAEGLPTDQSVDVSGVLALLDTWSTRVHSETQRHFDKFRRNPAEFNHSEGYFRMLALVTVLQQDFGVRYNPENAQQCCMWPWAGDSGIRSSW
jgi:hypothetical protein